jgi:3-oxoacyl-[acyl-carrier-protein] synthase II
MPDRRVVITGLGVVCPAGVGLEPFWAALRQGRSAVKTITLFDASAFPSSIGGQLDDFSARAFVPKDYRKAVKVMARDIEIAVAASDLAVRDSGLVTRGIDPDKPAVNSRRLGCNIGAGLICSDLDELGAALQTAVKDGRFDLGAWGSAGMNNLTPLWLLKYLPNMLACHVTIIHEAEGPSNTITCGDASGHLSVGEAWRQIARGDADAAIAGGAESKLNPMGLLRQSLLGRLVTTGNDAPAGACRPFDAGHAGTVVGEGGALLVLEEWEHAHARGARIYAELAGFGAACDPAAIDVRRPTAGGLDLALRRAMREAGIGGEEPGLIVAHGTGVPGEDDLEARAYEAALGADLDRIPATAVTGSTGSLFAGAGGMELAVAALALHHQLLPPAVNWAAPADGCRLNLSTQARAGPFSYAVSGAFSTGGQSGACVLRRYQP